MKRKRYTDEQIAYALRQAEAGTPIKEVCRKLGVSEQTLYTWRRKFAGMGVAELRELRQLRHENRARWTSSVAFTVPPQRIGPARQRGLHPVPSVLCSPGRGFRLSCTRYRRLPVPGRHLPHCQSRRGLYRGYRVRTVHQSQELVLGYIAPTPPPDQHARSRAPSCRRSSSDEAARRSAAATLPAAGCSAACHDATRAQGRSSRSVRASTICWDASRQASNSSNSSRRSLNRRTRTDPSARLPTPDKSLAASLARSGQTPPASSAMASRVRQLSAARSFRPSGTSGSALRIASP